MYASIYTSVIAEKASFLSLPYLEYHFMIANIVRLNLAVLKISETYRNTPVVESYVYPGCFPKKCPKVL